MENERYNKLISDISKVVKMAIMRPRGANAATIEEYFEKFSDQQLEKFVSKLSTSQWVGNKYFSLARVIKDDLVTQLIVGDTASQKALKHYNVTPLFIEVKNV